MSHDPLVYRQAHETAAAFSGPCTVLAVTGSDRVSFLHSILSQDIEGMREKEWREAALLSATSHVLAYLCAVKLEESILLISVPGQAEAFRQHLEKFIIAEDVAVRDASAEWQLVEFWGPRPEALIKALPDDALIETAHRNSRQRALISAEKKNFSVEIHACRDLREILRIENGVLEYGPDIHSGIMLSETGLEKIAASATKGCYPGQEVVAKIETYKRLNRSFVRLEWEGEILPEKKSAIYDAEGKSEIGCLTSRTYSPCAKKAIGLGWLKRGYFEKPLDVLIQFKTKITARTFQLS